MTTDESTNLTKRLDTLNTLANVLRIDGLSNVVKVSIEAKILNIVEKIHIKD